MLSGQVNDAAGVVKEAYQDSSTARDKAGNSALPVPVYSEFDDESRLRYYFSGQDEARQFLAVLQADAKVQAHGIDRTAVETLPENDKPQASRPAAGCFVRLTKEQFDARFGASSFAKLKQFDVSSRAEDYETAARGIDELDADLSNQVMVLRTPVTCVNGLHLAFARLNSDQMSRIYPGLTTSTLNAAAAVVINFPNYDNVFSCFAMNAALKQSESIVIDLLHKLSAETFNRLAQLTDTRNRNLFHHFNTYATNMLCAALIDKLDRNLLTRAYTILDKDGWSPLMRICSRISTSALPALVYKIGMPQYEEMMGVQDEQGICHIVHAAHRLGSKEFQAFIHLLTPDTCQRLACIRDNNGVTMLSLMMRNFNGNAFDFLNKLNSETISEHIAILAAISADGKSPIISICHRLDPAIYLEFAGKIGEESYAKMAGIQDERGVCQLVHAARHLRNSDFQAFINPLTPEVCQKIAFTKAKNGLTMLMLIIQQQNENSSEFLTKLSLDVLIQAMQQQLDHGPVFLEFIARYNKDRFISIINQLPPQVCVQAALMLNNNKTVLEKIAEYAGEAALCALLDKLYRHPEEAAKAAASTNHLLSIQFHDGGQSEDAWSAITGRVIKAAPAPRKRKDHADLSTQLSGGAATRPALRADFLQNIDKYGVKFLRLQGRTILLQDKEGLILAVKVQKHSESVDELTKEYNSTTYLRQHAGELRLQSALPAPVCITTINSVHDWLKPHVSAEELESFKKMTGTFPARSAYVYKVDPRQCDYFTYLHDPALSDAAYSKANRAAVHDLYSLLLRGVVFTQLGDIFHNSEHVEDRDDRGRYIVLVNLVRDGSGSGRLTGWKKAVEYPNVRASGLADLGDRTSINDFIGDTERVRRYYSSAYSSYRGTTGNYLLANIMAEYQYVLFLIAGRRGCELTERVKSTQGQTDEEIKAKISQIWLSLARQVVSNCAQAVAVSTHQPEAQAEKFLASVVDVSRLARQMQYWMTAEYIPDLKQNRIPEDIYGTGTNVFVNFSDFRSGTFNDVTGCAIDGVNPDLGAVNGQEPLKEANKLFYWMVNCIYEPYHQLRMTTQDIHKVLREADPEKSEQLRKSAFAYLPGKAYHGLQAVLCEERLKQQPDSLPQEARAAIAEEGKEHKRKHAGITIGQFWRDKRVKRARHETQAGEETAAPVPGGN